MGTTFTIQKSEKHTCTAKKSTMPHTNEQSGVAILAFPHWEQVACLFVANNF
jgi:hypothetical protein